MWMVWAVSALTWFLAVAGCVLAFFGVAILADRVDPQRQAMIPVALVNVACGVGLAAVVVIGKINGSIP